MLSPDAQRAYDAFVRWYEDQPDIRTLAVEKILYSKKYGYCGTCDGLLQINGKLVLYDLKTTNPGRVAPRGCYAEYMLQMAMYAQAYEEEHGECIDDYLVGNANKQGKFFATYASDIGRTPAQLKQTVFNTSLPALHKELAYLGKTLEKYR